MPLPWLFFFLILCIFWLINAPSVLQNPSTNSFHELITAQPNALSVSACCEPLRRSGGKPVGKEMRTHSRNSDEAAATVPATLHPYQVPFQQQLIPLFIDVYFAIQAKLILNALSLHRKHVELLSVTMCIASYLPPLHGKT